MIAYYRERLDDQFPGPERSRLRAYRGRARARKPAAGRRGRRRPRAHADSRVRAKKSSASAEPSGPSTVSGKRKRDFLSLQWTPDEIEQMRAIKHRFDPQWLLGRGTLLRRLRPERKALALADGRSDRAHPFDPCLHPISCLDPRTLSDNPSRSDLPGSG